MSYNVVAAGSGGSYLGNYRGSYNSVSTGSQGANSSGYNGAYRTISGASPTQNLSMGYTLAYGGANQNVNYGYNIGYGGPNQYVNSGYNLGYGATPYVNSGYALGCGNAIVTTPTNIRVNNGIYPTNSIVGYNGPNLTVINRSVNNRNVNSIFDIDYQNRVRKGYCDNYRATNINTSIGTPGIGVYNYGGINGTLAGHNYLVGAGHNYINPNVNIYRNNNLVGLNGNYVDPNINVYRGDNFVLIRPNLYGPSKCRCG